MNNLYERIQKLCPDGVEYKKLGEIAEMQRGTSITKKNVSFGCIPVISGGKEPAYYCNKSNRVGECITVAGSGAGAGYVQYWNTPIFVCDAFSIKGSEGVSTKYLYYCLTNLQEKIYATKKGGGVPHVHISSIDSLTIPVPPLQVQSEIVKILDNFTELTAELTARKKQYDYYCKQVFQNTSANIFVPIRDFGEWTGGCTPSMFKSTYWENGTIPWISSKDMKSATLIDTQNHITPKAIDETSAKLLPPDTVAIVARSGILKHTLPVAYIPFETTINQDIKALVVNEGVLPRYAYFVIYTYRKEILKKTKKKGGTVDSLDVNSFMNYRVPLLPIKEQHRIVSTLDRFNMLCNDLTSGLPAEIAARQKQYEYYRDKLLTFEERT